MLRTGFIPTQDSAAHGSPADLEDLSNSSTTSPGSSSDFLTDVSKDSKLGRVIAQLQSMGFTKKPEKPTCEEGHGEIVEVSSEDDSPRTVKYSEKSEEPKPKRTVKDVLKEARDRRLEGNVKRCEKGATSNPKAVDLAEGLGKKNPYVVPEHVA